MDPLTGLNRRREMGFAGTAPRGLLYILRETIRLGTPAAVDLRGPRPFSQLLQRIIQDVQTPREARSVVVGLDITRAATSSSTSNSCLETWPTRFGRFHFLLVMYTMDTEPLSSRRLLLSVGHGAATSTPGATFLYIWQQILLRGLA